MNLLITGANGQLGRELVRQSRDCDFQLQAFNRQQLDITDHQQVQRLLAANRPALLINAAAYTNVDGAEIEKDLAMAVNHTAAENLAQACNRNGLPLLHVSTDYVFDGQKDSPYRELDPIVPVGVYGQSKAAGESAVRANLQKHIILRTSWLYGVDGTNFVKTILKVGSEKEVINVVADQFGSPTSASDLAEAILSIATRIKNGLSVGWGTYHYCGHGIISRHEFAVMILELAKTNGMTKVSRVQPVTTAEYPTRAKRPAFSGLDCSLIQETFGIHPKPWSESLVKTIKRLFTAGETL